MKNKQIKLNPGEVLCDKCNGKGRITYSKHFSETCYKCKGVGKLDWIENIVGKTSSPNDLLEDAFYKQMAKELADAIDSEILKSLGVLNKIGGK